MNVPLSRETQDKLFIELKKWGLGFILFVILLGYVLWQNGLREDRLIAVIERTAPILQSVQHELSALREDVNELKHKEDR